MASAEQRARRRAQRATAKRVHAPGGYKPVLGKVAKPSRERQHEYLQNLLNNPGQITPEDHRVLARQASYAYWENKEPGRHPNIDPRYETWSEFFYHKEGL